MGLETLALRLRRVPITAEQVVVRLDKAGMHLDDTRRVVGPDATPETATRISGLRRLAAMSGLRDAELALLRVGRSPALATPHQDQAISGAGQIRSVIDDGSTDLLASLDSFDIMLARLSGEIEQTHGITRPGDMFEALVTRSTLLP